MMLKKLVLGLLLFAGSAHAALQYTLTHRNNDMSDLVTAMGSTGYIMLVTGTQPAHVSTSDPGTVLVSLPLSATPGTVSGGVLTFNAITSEAAIATGIAGHFLICSSNNQTNCLSGSTRVIQGSVASSGGDINFSSGTSFSSGVTISISSLSITAYGA